jgi:hypothetical protein
VKTEQRANRTNTMERIGERLVYKGCWNTLRAGKIMRRSRGRVASKRIRGEESQAETKDVRRKSADRPRIAKERKRTESSTDRDFLGDTIHTTGGDRSERKRNFLGGGSTVRKFFVDLGSSLGNLI